MKRYTLKQLEQKKTLSTGQADDLKVETRSLRVWLSRCGVEDGEPYDHKVTVERWNGRQWVTVEEYQAE